MDTGKTNTIVASTFFSELLKAGVDLSERDMLEVARRYEKAKSEMPFRDVIHDLVYNQYNKKWQLKRADAMSRKMIALYNEKAPVVQVDYTESGDYVKQ